MSMLLKEVEFIESVSGLGGNSKRWESVPRLNKGGAEITWEGPVIVMRGLANSKHKDDLPIIVPLSRVHSMVPADKYPAAKGKR